MADDGWVTYHRIWSTQLRAWVLVQKKDGCTRTIIKRSRAA